MHNTFGIYLFTQAGMFGITIMILAIANALREWDDIIFLVVPLPSVFIGAGFDRKMDEPIHLAFAIAVLAISVAFPLLRQRQNVKAFFSALGSPK